MVCLITGLILMVRCAKGREHDFSIWKKGKVKLNPKASLYADLGFLGICKLHLKSILPHKASKKHPLTKEQKQENKEQAKVRVPVEHLNRQCKIFRITKDTYRGKHKNYGLNWNLVAAIVNFKIACRHFNQTIP